MCPARKKLFDEIPYLEGERVILRKITEDDRETLWEMAHSDIIYRYKHGVNLFAFCYSYMSWFWQSPEVWPKNRKSKNEKYSFYTPKDFMYWHYDCRRADNRFNINELYRRLPRKLFLKGSKKKLEAVMMYSWLLEIGADDNTYWEEYCEEYEREQEH